MTITGKILEWVEEQNDKITEEIMTTDRMVRPCMKAFGLGAIEGAIDYLVIGVPVTLVVAVIASKVKKN